MPAAMEPVQIGRADDTGWPTRPKIVPQWSPSRSDGVTRTRRGEPVVVRHAAMEPVQIGRGDPDDAAGTAGANPTAAMEPVQIGRGDSATRSTSRTPTRCRNGARPDRTG